MLLGGGSSGGGGGSGLSWKSLKELPTKDGMLEKKIAVKTDRSHRFCKASLVGYEGLVRK